MSKQSSMNQLQKIAQRICEMRRILGYSVAEMAEMTEVSEETYRSYETGTVDLPFTFIHKCAKAYGLEITDILEGHSAKLSGYTITRKGQGICYNTSAISNNCIEKCKKSNSVKCSWHYFCWWVVNCFVLFLKLAMTGLDRFFIPTVITFILFLILFFYNNI